MPPSRAALLEGCVRRRAIDKQPFREEEIMKGHICHIEIPADNLGSLQKFYGGLFDWNYEKVPGDFEY